MPDDNKKRAHRTLVDSILTGEGKATAAQRAQAFTNDGLPEPLRTLLDNVTTTPVQVTDADFAATKSAGYTEDQLFELVICAVVGQSTRLYEAGLTALAEATGESS